MNNKLETQYADTKLIMSRRNKEAPVTANSAQKYRIERL